MLLHKSPKICLNPKLLSMLHFINRSQQAFISSGEQTNERSPIIWPHLILDFKLNRTFFVFRLNEFAQFAQSSCNKRQNHSETGYSQTFLLKTMNII